MKVKFYINIIFLLVATAAQAQVNLKSGLVAHYTLEGHAADSSTNQLHGVIFGTSNTTNRFGKAGAAIKLNGNGDYIAVPHNNKFNLVGERSFSVWYKIDNLTLNPYASLFFKQGDQFTGSYPCFTFQLTEELGYGVNRYQISYFNGQGSTNRAVYSKQLYTNYVGVWVHVAGTYSIIDGYMRIFFNGVIRDSLYTPSFAPNTSSDSLQIGRGNKFNYIQSYFKGSIDDIRIYDRTLNKAEVLALYNERYYTYTSLSKYICPGDSIQIFGKYKKLPGAYNDTVNISSGYDSVITTNLFYNPVYAMPQSITICQGGKVFLSKKFQTISGIYYDSLKTNKGCDSIIITTLTVNPTFLVPKTITLCNGDSALAAKKFQKTSGIYYDTLTAANGCDSIIATTLVVNPKYQILRNVNICQGESILLAGKLQTAPGNYTDSFKTAKGCDSIIISSLAVNPRHLISRNISSCQGDSILLGGKFRSVSGIYYDSLKTTKGCDSVIVTTLIINPKYFIINNIKLCPGQKIMIAGILRDTAGTYYENLKTNKGCDSTIASTINFLPQQFVTNNIKLCQGQKISIAGVLRDTAGTYYETLKTSKGCDSTVITSLSFYPVSYTYRSVSICSKESIIINKKNVSAPGIYTDSFKTAIGCDSLVYVTVSVSAINKTVTQVGSSILKALQDSASYQWLDCNNFYLPVAGETGQILYPKVDGKYAVQIRKNNCTDTSICFSVLGLGTNGSNLAESIKLFPNPASNTLTVTAPDISSIQITDLQGRVVAYNTVSENANTHDLDISTLSNGLYMVKVTTAAGVVVQKVIVQK